SSCLRSSSLSRFSSCLRSICALRSASSAAFFSCSLRCFSFSSICALGGSTRGVGAGLGSTGFGSGGGGLGSTTSGFGGGGGGLGSTLIGANGLGGGNSLHSSATKGSGCLRCQLTPK